MKKKNIVVVCSSFLIAGVIFGANSILAEGLFSTMKPDTQKVALTNTAVSSNQTMKTDSISKEKLETRLFAMSEQEIQEYCKVVDEGKEEVSSIIGRDLTEEEENRKKILHNSYAYEGKFPEGKLPYTGGENDFYYVIEKCAFHLPSTALTDEQILQWLDFEYKTNYSLMTRNNKTMPPKENPLESMISEIEAEKIAVTMLEKVYDVNLSNMDISTMYKTEMLEVPSYMVSIQPYKRELLDSEKDLFWDYSCFVDANTREVKGFSCISMMERNLCTSLKTIDGGQNESLFQKAFIDFKCISDEKDYKNVWGYGYKKTDGDYGRLIRYVFESENGKSYILSYWFDIQKLYKVEIYDTQDFKNSLIESDTAVSQSEGAIKLKGRLEFFKVKEYR